MYSNRHFNIWSIFPKPQENHIQNTKKARLFTRIDEKNKRPEAEKMPKSWQQQHVETSMFPCYPCSFGTSFLSPLFPGSSILSLSHETTRASAASAPKAWGEIWVDHFLKAYIYPLYEISSSENVASFEWNVKKSSKNIFKMEK